MSYAMNIHEKITITGNNAPVQKLKERLITYICQINHMTCLEAIDSLLLTLSNGTDTVRCDIDVDMEPGNTWVMTENGLRQKQAAHVLWMEDHPLMKMLASLGAATEVIFEWNASLMKMSGADYGSTYWQELIAGTGLEPGISYRALETNDFDACARAVCKQGESGFVSLSPDQPPDVVEDIHQWYCGNFRFRITGADESEWDAFEKSIEEAQEAFAEAFDDCPDVDVFDGEAKVTGSLTVTKEQLEELVAALQKFADIAKAFSACVDMEMDFEPDEVNENGFTAFALIRVKCDNGRVSVSAGRFD